MRIWRILAVCLGLGLLIIPLLALPHSEAGFPEPSRVPQTASTDDEIVLVGSDGRIYVADPHQEAGMMPVEFTSPDAGWTKVATGDFNGDGDDEIVAIGGGKAKLFDPVAGTTPVSYEWPSISPYEWRDVAVGDIDQDGRDEIIFERSTEEWGNINARVVVYDGNATGTAWTVLRNEGFGAQWRDVEAGDINADGTDEIAMIRDVDNLLYLWKPTTAQVLHQETFGYWWRDVELGDVDRDGRQEIILIRDVLTPHAGLTVKRFVATGQALQSVYDEGFGASWIDVEVGDLNADGDMEIILLRNVPSSYVGLTVRDQWGTSRVGFEASIGEGWLNVETGDTDGDGRAEIIIVKGDSYRIYTSPEASTGYIDYGGSWAGGIATGNLDGTGVPYATPTPTPTATSTPTPTPTATPTHTPAPTLSVSPSEMRFLMAYDAADKQASGSLSLSNVTSSEAIAWTATLSPARSWIISPTFPISGSTPGTITLSVDGSGLITETYVTIITVTAGDPAVQNGTHNIPVWLIVAQTIYKSYLPVVARSYTP